MEEKMYSYKYPHPAVTADNVIFGFDNNDLNILLIKRKLEPYKDCWAFPGGFMNIDETIEECAARELKEETNFITHSHGVCDKISWNFCFILPFVF